MEDREPGAHVDERAAGRLGGFSDGVLSIAITLLAIDLPVPEGNNAGEFWTSVRANQNSYIAFLISFTAIAAAWNSHHDVFRYVERVDPRLRTLTMTWLCTIVLNPFATRMLTWKGPDTTTANALRFGFYALLEVLSGVLLLVILRHMEEHGLAPGARRQRAYLERGARAVAIAFGASIPVFFVWQEAWVLWFVIPLVMRAWRLARRRGSAL